MPSPENRRRSGGSAGDETVILWAAAGARRLMPRGERWRWGRAHLQVLLVVRALQSVVDALVAGCRPPIHLLSTGTQNGSASVTDS